MLTVTNLTTTRLEATLLDKADNWNELPFKEALLIKSHKPSLNTGLNASKELQFFQFNFTDIIQVNSYITPYVRTILKTYKQISIS